MNAIQQMKDVWYRYNKGLLSKEEADVKLAEIFSTKLAEIFSTEVNSLTTLLEYFISD